MSSGELGALSTAFVTFKDAKALEIALLLSVISVQFIIFLPINGYMMGECFN